MFIYIGREQGDREEYITQENEDKKIIYIDIYENLRSPYISSLTC